MRVGRIPRKNNRSIDDRHLLIAKLLYTCHLLTGADDLIRAFGSETHGLYIEREFYIELNII